MATAATAGQAAGSSLFLSGGNTNINVSPSQGSETISGSIADDTPDGYPGGIRKNLGGTLILTGSNTYTGGTAIEAGTLQIGNGGTSGSITGDVTNTASLVFDRADSSSFTGSATGSGSFKQAGTGTLIVTGTISNPVTISSGTLQVGNGGTTGSITSSISGAGNLAFDRSDNLSFGNVFPGGGSLIQNGTGTITLAAANTYKGSTIINSGTLQLAGPALSAPSGYAAFYSFDNVSGSTVINGGSGGSTYNATLGGDAAISAGGIQGKALWLVDNTAILTPNTAFPGGDNVSTESAWFNGLNASTLTRYLFGSTNGDSEALLTSGSGYTLGDSTIGVVHSTGINLSAYTSGWHQLTVVQNFGPFNTTYYIDGQFLATITDSFSPYSFNAFGNIVGGQPFAQYLDDVYVYNNQALTAAQVQQLYESALTGSLPTGTAVQIGAAGTLDLGGNNQSIGSLTGATGSRVLLETGNLTVGSNNTSTTFSGVIFGTGSVTKTGNGTLMLAGPNIYSGGTTVSSGTLVAANVVALGTGAVTVKMGAVLQVANTFHATLVAPSFIVQTGGLADLGKSDLLITSTGTDPYAITLASLKAAYDSGKWDRDGIRSSALGTGMALGIYDNSLQTQSTLDGISADPRMVLIKYTWLGDANLDGIVDSADLTAMSSAGTTWQTGDFNYDGKVNADDYALFALGATVSGGANISTTLPEPVAALGLLAAPLMIRRRQAAPDGV